MSSREDLAICLDQHPGQQRDVVLRGYVADVEVAARELRLEGGHILDDGLAPA